MHVWKTGERRKLTVSAHTAASSQLYLVDLEEAEEARMQLGILSMWVERVSHEVHTAEGGV